MRTDLVVARSVAVVESTTRLGEMPPLHAHDEDEAFHVLEGSIIVHAGNETVRLEAGDAFVAPKGVPHTHRAETTWARYLTMTFARSADRYEDFLRAVAEPADGFEPSEGRSWVMREEPAAIAVTAAASGITVLGPPGMLPA